jgi:hypothetical protein
MVATTPKVAIAVTIAAAPTAARRPTTSANRGMLRRSGIGQGPASECATLRMVFPAAAQMSRETWTAVSVAMAANAGSQSVSGLRWVESLGSHYGYGERTPYPESDNPGCVWYPAGTILLRVTHPEATEQSLAQEGATDDIGTTYPAAPDAAALRDAAVIARRITADEEAADAERARLVDGDLPDLRSQVDGALPLTDGEVVHAIRPSAMLEESDAATPMGGSLYLTSRRLVHVGEASREIKLDTIEESAVALERLLLLDLTDGSDLAIEVDQPRLLRVQLAAARANRRRRTP